MTEQKNRSDFFFIVSNDGLNGTTQNNLQGAALLGLPSPPPSRVRIMATDLKDYACRVCLVSFLETKTT